METKEKLSYFTCIAAFILGWALTIADFIIPPVAEVSDSVLWVLGQALLYTSAVLGINNFYAMQLSKFKNEIKSEIRK